MTRRRALCALALVLALCSLTHLSPRPQPSPVYSVRLPEQPLSVAIDAARGRILLLTYPSAPYGPFLVAPAPRASATHLHVLALATGAALSAPAPAPLGATTVLGVAARQHRVVVSGRRASVATLDTAQGAVAGVAAVGELPLAAVVDERRGAAYVLCVEGTLVQLDVRTGTLLRRVTMGAWAVDLALDARAHTLLVSGWGPDGVGRLSLLDAPSLRLRRTLRLGESVGRLAVGARLGRVFALRPTDQVVSMLDGRGTLLATRPVSQTVGAGAVVDERTERVFVANTRDNTVSILDERTGRLVRTVRVGPMPVALLVAERAQRIVVVNAGDGTLSVLDAHGGVVRRTLVVGPNPVAAVDDSSGRLVVASGPASAPRPSWLDRLVQQVPWLPWHATTAAWVPGAVTLFDLTR